MVRRRKTEAEAILGPLQGFLIGATAKLIATLAGPTVGYCAPEQDAD